MGKKPLILIGACLVLIINACFWWYGQQVNQLISANDDKVASRLIDTVLTTHHWKELEAHETWEPNTLAQGLLSHAFEWQVILPGNPQGLASAQNELESSLVSMWQRSEGEFVGPPYESLGRTSEGVFHYYQPVYAKKVCVTCHCKVGKTPRPDLTTGDLMAVMHISFPNSETVQAQRQNQALVLTTSIVTSVACLLGVCSIVRYSVAKTPTSDDGKAEPPIR